MRLLRLLYRESTRSPWFMALIAGLSGLSNALVLTIINLATDQSSEDSSWIYIISFVIVIGTYLISQRYILVTTIKEVDTILHKIRLRVVDKIRNADLMPLEQIGRSEIYASVSKEMQTISNASMSMVLMCQSAILIFFTLVYIAWLSLIALALFIIVITGGVGFYFLKMSQLKQDIHEAMDLENELFETLTHLMDGFKEVKMSERRSADLNEHIQHISTSVVEVKGNVSTQISVVNVFAQTSFYLLAASVVFILPLLDASYSDMLGELAAGVLFLTGPIVALVGSVQMFMTANVAAENVDKLEQALDRQVRSLSQRRAKPLVIRKAPFADITFERTQFEFAPRDGQPPFKLGPINLSISRGETIFITGGNGSGKSTFLRVLTCLYFPTRGVVKLDGQRLSEANAAAYRDLFSVIFYDYHLFDRLYGFDHVDMQRVDELLKRLQLQGKTSLQGHRFENLDLSSGQKRRLALLVSYLEDKPICVFDEWTAEQDPDFRQYFYTNVLPELKAQGKTIIAVTHDDHYYHMKYVDRILKLNNGRLMDHGAAI